MAIYIKTKTFITNRKAIFFEKKKSDKKIVYQIHVVQLVFFFKNVVNNNKVYSYLWKSICVSFEFQMKEIQSKCYSVIK